MMQRPIFAVLLAALLCSPLVAAPPPAATPLTISLYWENDSRELKPNHPTDRHYTNGMGFSVAWQGQLPDAIAPYVPFADQFGPARTAMGVEVGQLMFTPAVLNARIPDPTDEPYAGYLFTGVYWQRANDFTMDHIQLDVGVIGPSSGAEWVQKTIHSTFGATKPLGWGHQLYDEPTGELTIRKKWRFNLAQGDVWSLPAGVQMIPQVGLGVGNVQRYLEAGTLLRVGVNLPDDFGPARLLDVAAATGKPVRGWSAYGFAAVLGRYVQHNTLLEGNSFRDSPGVDEKPLIGEARLGFAVAYQAPTWNVGLVYSQTFDTKQFEHQHGTDAYGALTVTGTVWF